MGYGSYVAAAAEISVTTATRSNCIASSRRPTPDMRSIRRRSSGRSRAPSFTGCPALFHGGITVKDGRVEQHNFDDYKSMLIKDMPKVETIVMPSGGFWGGVGEPTICVAAPAVLNAYFAATGKRIRSVPLKNEGVELA